MNFCDLRTTVLCALVLFSSGRAECASDEQLGGQQLNLPTVQFFYYDAAGVEWAVSAKPERLRAHLASNPDSQTLFETVSSAALGSFEANDAAERMTSWIESERKRFEQSRREAVRIRMAEGILAYLRAHDFSVTNLVEALKRRSGATDVELVAIHLLDDQNKASYKLKVVLVDSDVEIGKQGFNIRLRSPTANYAAVTYALGVALYELQEIIHGDAAERDADGHEEVLPLPLPESFDGPTLAPTEAVSR